MSHKYRMVEGGQLFMHRLRMFKQTFKIVTSLSFLAIILLVAAVFFMRFDYYECYITVVYYWTQLKVQLYHFLPKSYSYVDVYYIDGSVRRIPNNKLLSDPRIFQTVKEMRSLFYEILSYIPYIVVVSYIGSFLFFGRFSRKQRSQLSSKQRLRGQKLETPKNLRDILVKSKQASDLNLDGLPLVKDKETSHILVTGTTGSGKTNCINTLLPQIRKRGDSGIIVDMTGDMTNRYYREGKDILLSPLDDRTQNWGVWDECTSQEELASFAETFIPQKGRNQDPFWEVASRKILIAALDLLKDRRDLSELFDILVKADLKTYHQFFEGTEAASFTDIQGGKTTLSIRATLASQVACLKLLGKETKNSFSIKRWLASEPNDQWLFLTAKPSQRNLLKPLISAWLDTSINGLMSLEPNQERRVWFVIDELPSLNTIPALKTGLAELRKYGGCILSGMQSFSQLEEIYGHSASQAMLDLYNTKLIFRSTDPSTSQWASKVLGDYEFAESNESLSFGANSIRDGVSLGRAERIKQIALPSEIASLEDLTCYVKYPGDLPSAKQTMTYKAS